MEQTNRLIWLALRQLKQGFLQKVYIRPPATGGTSMSSEAFVPSTMTIADIPEKYQTIIQQSEIELEQSKKLLKKSQAALAKIKPLVYEPILELLISEASMSPSSAHSYPRIS